MNWRRYYKQLVLWLVVVTVMKLTVLVFLVVFEPLLAYLAALALSPVRGDYKAKLVVVMVITPVIMNSLQFWVTDSFLKKHGPPGPCSDAGEEEGVGLADTVAAQ